MSKRQKMTSIRLSRLPKSASKACPLDIVPNEAGSVYELSLHLVSLRFELDIV